MRVARCPAAQTAYTLSVHAEGADDMQVLATGGRTNVLGFVLRLAARLPFLLIAGRWYGEAALGRFAYAVLVVEFLAQLATLGLKRGLAAQLSADDRPHGHIVWDAMLVTGLASALGAGVLCAMPSLMFPNSGFDRIDGLLPLMIFGVVWGDIALAALAYRHDVASTVRARALVEPWAISLGAFAFASSLRRSGLMLAYAVSIVSALVTALVPFVRAYGWPWGWRPRPAVLAATVRQNMPLAAADVAEWASRRVDIAILGLFFPASVVGVYYVAQQVATLPQKLKTSFDPILAPVITRSLAVGDTRAVAAQVAQVGFWILAAQVGIGLALAMVGGAVMGLVGSHFMSGGSALTFLLAAEAVAATAAVSESALVYVARHRNLLISLVMLGVQAALSVALVGWLRAAGASRELQAAGPAVALCVSLGGASLAKARLLSRLLGAPVSGWRWALVWAAGAAVLVGLAVTRIPRAFAWAQLAAGIPLMLGVYAWVLWHTGFGPSDRALFRLRGRGGDEPVGVERCDGVARGAPLHPPGREHHPIHHRQAKPEVTVEPVGHA